MAVSLKENCHLQLAARAQTDDSTTVDILHVAVHQHHSEVAMCCLQLRLFGFWF